MQPHNERVHSARDALFRYVHNKLADKKIRLKKLFKNMKLCYSIEEANGVFNDRIARIISAGANDRKVLAYGSFNIWWRNITTKKLSANLYSNREIRFARVFCFEFLNDYV